MEQIIAVSKLFDSSMSVLSSWKSGHVSRSPSARDSCGSGHSEGTRSCGHCSHHCHTNGALLAQVCLAIASENVLKGLCYDSTWRQKCIISLQKRRVTYHALKVTITELQGIKLTLVKQVFVIAGMNEILLFSCQATTKSFAQLKKGI